MTLEEMFVEKYHQMENKISALEKSIASLNESLEEKSEELDSYEAFIAFLQEHICVRSYGVFIEFPNFKEDHKDCVEELSTFFDIGDVEDEEAEDEG